MRRVRTVGALLRTGAAMAALAASGMPACQSADAARSPLDSSALWVVQAASAQRLTADAQQAGVSTLFVKAAEGSTVEPQFTSGLIGALRAAGVSVCAWTFAYGQRPLAEAEAAIAAVHAGARCLVVDAEGPYDKRYGAAQAFVRALRSRLGARFPIGLAGQAETLEHPTFPYSVFLGPGGFEVNMPQIYWRDLGLSVDGGYEATIGVNAIYGRPIAPVGQLYNGAEPTEVQRFRSLAGAYRCPGVSFFDLDAASPPALAALLSAPAPLAALPIVPATVRPGADGDEIVWAQELLDAAGARLPVGGFFGAQTARALAAFQARHRLPADGLLDGPTWRALLLQHPHEPAWSRRPPDSAR